MVRAPFNLLMQLIVLVPFATILVLVIVALVLSIKALRIYIRKNS